MVISVFSADYNTLYPTWDCYRMIFCLSSIERGGKESESICNMGSVIQRQIDDIIIRYYRDINYLENSNNIDVCNFIFMYTKSLLVIQFCNYMHKFWYIYKCILFLYFHEMKV